MAKVNIIMSVYNQEMYLNECIDSLLNQSYTDYELIIINDGSVDNSEKIILSYKDERINYLSNKENKGLIYSLNLGIALSQQTDCIYIARMDSDDIAVKTRLAQQVAYLDSNPEVGLLGGAMEFFGKNISSTKKYAPSSEKKIISTFFSYNPFYHPTMMFRKTLVTNKKYSFNFPKYEDYGLWIDLIGTCKFHNLTNVLVLYRRHNTSVTSTYKNELQQDQQTFIKLICSLAAKLDIQLDNDVVHVLSIITTANRATIDSSITVDRLKSAVDTVTEKANKTKTKLDLGYLRQVLVERCILYLKTNGRSKEILPLLYSLKAFKEAIAISISLSTGRRL